MPCVSHNDSFKQKNFSSSLKSEVSSHPTTKLLYCRKDNYSKFLSTKIYLSRRRRRGKKEIITLNCPTVFTHARISSRPYGANDNLFCLDSAAIASPHCREKHCLGATPTSHDTPRLCFVVPWNWLPSCSPDTFSFTRISRMFAWCKSALPFPRILAPRKSLLIR